MVRQWFLLGAYDFLSVVEAPDERTISRLSVELASRGSATFETLPAIPVEELIAALDPGERSPLSRRPRRAAGPCGRCAPPLPAGR